MNTESTTPKPDADLSFLDGIKLEDYQEVTDRAQSHIQFWTTFSRWEKLVSLKEEFADEFGL